MFYVTIALKILKKVFHVLCIMFFETKRKKLGVIQYSKWQDQYIKNSPNVSSRYQYRYNVRQSDIEATQSCNKKKAMPYTL
jgi:hypothetical protein